LVLLYKDIVKLHGNTKVKYRHIIQPLRTVFHENMEWLELWSTS